MTGPAIEEALAASYASLPEEAACGLPVRRGKVRDVVCGADKLLLVASDRISAFDRVLAAVPFKGEVLSRISAWWFERTADILPNHILPGGNPSPSMGTGRATLARRADMIPVEVVVRGCLAGSAWRDYRDGRPVSGVRLPAGLVRNEALAAPIVTPSTKEEGGHDRPLSRDQILAGDLLARSAESLEPRSATRCATEELWAEVEGAALALFRRGQELALRAGLVLADTKYEFGLVDGRLVIADELHSPDSSRYWWSDTYERRLGSGEDQRELDKEPFRRWLAARGFTGEGEAPAIPDEVRVETSRRYIEAYATITGEEFEPFGADLQSENAAIARMVRERLR